MLQQDALAGPADPLAKLGLHHAPRAKRVIYIHMVGAPSHLDLFDRLPQKTRQVDRPIAALIRDLPRAGPPERHPRGLEHRVRPHPHGKVVKGVLA